MSIDTNIDNYTIEDMEDFLELPPDYTESYVNMLIDSIPIYDDEKLKFIEDAPGSYVLVRSLNK